MLKKILQLLFAPIGGAIGYWIWILLSYGFSKIEFSLWGWLQILIELSLIAFCAVIGFLLGGPAANGISKLLTGMIVSAKKMPAKEFFMSIVGLVIGLLCAYLLCHIFDAISNEILVTCINAIIYIVMGVFGVRVARMRRDDYVLPVKNTASDCGGTVLDASVLIDGRAYDIFKTGFLTKPVYIPKFVMDELSRLSDSEDTKKRSRGHIGLDTVKKLQAEKGVYITSGSYAEDASKDDLIISFAKEYNASVMTNDYSLNMVASVQGITILNINELANTIKISVVSGDELTVEITKSGKEPTQGVGYLDDGTMVVVENGNAFVDKTVSVLVTSILQTNAGKIVFAKLK